MAGKADRSAQAQVRDQVVDHIHHLIVSGQARSDTLVRLAPLAEALEVSITPVREALLLLARDGWVVQEPNRGFRVMPIRRSDLEDAYVVQAFLAGELAARAAAQEGPKLAVRLREIDRAIDELTAGKGPLTGEAADEARALEGRFRELVEDAAASPRLAVYRAAARSFAPDLEYATDAKRKSAMRRGRRAIVKAIEAADPDEARTQMRDYVERGAASALAQVDATGHWVGL